MGPGICISCTLPSLIAKKPKFAPYLSLQAWRIVTLFSGVMLRMEDFLRKQLMRFSPGKVQLRLTHGGSISGVPRCRNELDSSCGRLRARRSQQTPSEDTTILQLPPLAHGVTQMLRMWITSSDVVQSREIYGGCSGIVSRHWLTTNPSRSGFVGSLSVMSMFWQRQCYGGIGSGGTIVCLGILLGTSAMSRGKS